MDHHWLDIRKHLSDLIYAASQKTEGFNKDFEPEVRIADPRFGDFQANGVLGFAKKNKQKPRQLAEALLKQIQEDQALKQFEITLSGPGFLNIRLQPEFLQGWVKQFNGHCDLTQIYKDKTVVIDYSCPNSAKQMHVGHLRSIIIGECIQRLMRFCGANVVRDNHIGDWGTQFGILIMAVKREKIDVDKIDESQAIETFERLYKEGVALTKEDQKYLEEARRELVALQKGDPENTQIWEKINEVSYRSFQVIYDLMDIKFDYVLGESFYRDKVDRVYKELEDLKLAEISNGALVVFHRDVPRFKDQPFIVRKSDGASNYAATDLATILYRVEHFHANEIIYVTDGRQQDHFQLLFLTVGKWFPAFKREIPKLDHVWFGTVLGEDGKAIKTRSGESIKLKQLIDEGISRALEVVKVKNPDLTEEEQKEVARVVGISAIKYADLSQNRTNDYAFSWDKMLNFDGNTAPYLLYGVARIYAIFRKMNRDPKAPVNTDKMELFSSPEELALARKLIAFPGIIDQVLEDLRPHFLCKYLFDLTSSFSSFYNVNRIVGEPEEIENKRILLCQFTLYILETGLSLLGIETLQKM